MRILHNARFFTLDPETPDVQAAAISGGKILAVGNLEDFADISPGKVERIDLRGRYVLPGMVDSHIHLSNYAFFLQRVDGETATIEECLGRVKTKAGELAPGEWGLGHGWNQNVWANGFGSAAQLDQQAPNNPVYLTGKSMHAGWANSPALKAAGITSSTLDPTGGQIVRDERGQPTGILLESAMKLVEKVIPPPTPEEHRKSLLAAQTALWKLGLTGVHDFDGIDSFDALQSLDLDDRLRLRVTKSIPLDFLDEAIALRLHSGFGSAFLKIGSVKMFADGALGPKTGAMIQPYERETTNRGMLLLDHEEIFETGQKAAACGISLAVHAIGDRANHEVIQGMAHLRNYEKEAGFRPLQHRIEHVQVLHPDDFDLLSKNGIIASMQPIHATSDMYIADLHLGSRAAGSYAWNTLLKTNTRLIFGSDAPVESPNPFYGIHAAATRTRTDGSPGPEGWYPDQRLSLHQAILGYTSGKMISPGQPADLIILDEDPYSIQPSELWRILPSSTMVAGEWVWQEER
ncbi:MAG: amidohydrolase [Anaerolineaceae bacterium]